jgi:hypothetical protein
MQVLAFVARRALADRLALVFSVREPSEERELVVWGSRTSASVYLLGSA